MFYRLLVLILIASAMLSTGAL